MWFPSILLLTLCWHGKFFSLLSFDPAVMLLPQPKRRQRQSQRVHSSNSTNVMFLQGINLPQHKVTAGIGLFQHPEGLAITGYINTPILSNSSGFAIGWSGICVGVFETSPLCIMHYPNIVQGPTIATYQMGSLNPQAGTGILMASQSGISINAGFSTSRKIKQVGITSDQAVGVCRSIISFLGDHVVPRRRAARSSNRACRSGRRRSCLSTAGARRTAATAARRTPCGLGGGATDAEVLRGAFQRLALAARGRAAGDTVTLPVYVVYGAADGMVPAKGREWLKSVLESAGLLRAGDAPRAWTEVPDAGHDDLVFLEDVVSRIFERVQ
ncbi:hypothetical protein GGX14DRAFT_601131 [Mycena pura]|uniref:Uncharacterized protein n=1 Tax=Mycena pura TaxID=153505 RepID=A0AAD6UNN3_9AGAR|nr:hypothetical protein GGX14DRAFT_601131 [Mycena pura]